MYSPPVSMETSHAMTLDSITVFGKQGSSTCQ